MPRNWIGALQRASYRGAAFWVDKDSIETGRRLIIHEFPHRDVPYVEDMGRDANKIQVTAYVVGDSSDREASSLMRACEAGGPASLQLPLVRLQAHCERAKRAFDKDKLGLIAFDIAFVREGSGAAPISLPALGNAVSVAAGGIAEPLRTSFLAGYQGLGVATYVSGGSVETIEEIAAELEAVRASNPVDAVLAPPIMAAIQAIASNAAELARVGAIGDSYTLTSGVTNRDVSLEAPVVDQVASVVAELRAAIDPALVIVALQPLTAFGLTPPPVPATTPSRLREDRNKALLSMLVRVSALAQMCAAIVEIDFHDRRTAIQARADIAEAIDAELDVLTGPYAYAAALALVDLRGRTVDYLSRTIADLAPIITVSALASMPSLWWANRLYGDAARAGDIATRNRIKHPSFMPLEFEALVR